PTAFETRSRILRFVSSSLESFSLRSSSLGSSSLGLPGGQQPPWISVRADAARRDDTISPACCQKFFAHGLAVVGSVTTDSPHCQPSTRLVSLAWRSTNAAQR